MLVIRVLLYEGDSEWIEKTFLRAAVKGERIFDNKGRVLELLRTDITEQERRIISTNLPIQHKGD